MNSAVITKIEYRLKGTEVFQEILFTAFTAKLSQLQEHTNAGTIYTNTLGFKIPKCTDENDALLKSLAAYRSIWKVTDANSVVHTIGTDDIPARLNFSKNIEGQPGNYNGYELSVTAKSI
ncbi:MAG: hypothetical protein A2066_12910 [Bacteroidetes bacterium GWB2_41_8]|nr:MAG: hypothetical protein A2066_12910 [Bacteroidetes bacterium GWB2_41_8]